MRPAERFAAGVAGTLFVILMIWCGAPDFLGPTYAALPAEVYFPDEVSAAVRLHRFQPAFDQYWQRRGFPETDVAIEEILRSVAPWDEWREDLSEEAIRRRITAYREAIFQLFGPESWLVFGQWAPREPGGPSETALLLYLQEGAAIRLAVAPLLKLLLPNAKTQTIDYRGFEILKYTDEKERDDWSVVRLGGWVCVSMRNRNTRALERVIDQYIEARDGFLAIAQPYFPESGEGKPGERVPAIRARIATEPLWRHQHDFSVQRQARNPIGKKEDRTERWQKRLRNVTKIEFTQFGDALLDLDLSFQGPRIEKLEKLLREKEGGPLDAPQVADLVSERDLPLSAVQMDFSYPMATRGLRVVGLKWDDFLDEIDDLKWFAPGLKRRLEQSMYEDEAPAQARIGASLTRSGGLSVPAVTVWRDHPPVIYTRHSPADAWLVRAHARYRGEQDYLFSSVPSEQKDPAPAILIDAQRELADRVWSSPLRPPEAFFVFNFNEVVLWLDSVPRFLVHGSDSFSAIRHFCRGLELATGSLVLRFDVVEGEATLRMRTLEDPDPPMKPDQR